MSEAKQSDSTAELGGWEHLKAYGYAPGGYMNRCHRCYQVVTGVDKRAITCRPCAEAVHRAMSPNTEAMRQAVKDES